MPDVLYPTTGNTDWMKACFVLLIMNESGAVVV